MDGVHDMGGMDGFGKVEPEPNEPVFHYRWEGRVLAMSRAIGVFRSKIRGELLARPVPPVEIDQRRPCRPIDPCRDVFLITQRGA